MLHEEGGYQHGSHRKGSLKVHLVFVTRFRKRLLDGGMADICKNALQSTAARNGWDIIRMECDRDHVHLLLEYPPTASISSIVQKLKRESTHSMWQQYGGTLRKEYWHQDTFWSKGYFYCSIGGASSDTIMRYIENQG